MNRKREKYIKSGAAKSTTREKLSAWLLSQAGTLPRRLALDGNFVKEVMGVVSMVDCETEAPVAVEPSSH